MNNKTSFMLVLSLAFVQVVSLAGLNLYSPKILADSMPTDAQYVQIIENLKVINNLKASISADTLKKVIKNLDQHHYQEITKAFMGRLRFEVNAAQPHFDVIEALLASLKKQASFTDVQSLKLIENEFDQKHSYENDQDVERIAEKFSQVISDAAQRMTQPPSLKMTEGRIKSTSLIVVKKNLAPSSFLAYIDLHSQKGGEAFILSKVISGEISEEVKSEILNGTFIPAREREKVITDVLDILIQMKGRVAVLTGQYGVGKKAVVRQLAYDLINNQYPQTTKFKEHLDGAEVISIDAHPTFNIEQFMQILTSVQTAYSAEAGKNQQIIVVVNNIDTLQPAQIRAIIPFFNSEHANFKIIGMSSAKSFVQKFKLEEDILNFLQVVGVPELTAEQTFNVLKDTWVKKIESQYSVTFSEGSVKAAVKMAGRMYPDLARPEGPIRVLQAAAIRNHRLNEQNVDEKAVFTLASEKLGYPTNVQSASEFKAYLDKLSGSLKESIAGQNEMIDSLVKHFGDLLQGESSKPKVIQLIGTSGVGKTLLGEKIAEMAFGNKNHLLTIDGGQFKDIHFSTSTLFGAGPGYISSDKTSGMVPDWLDDASRGRYGGIILINEAEKMNPEIWTRFMEMFDTGVVTGADGKVRYAKNHLIVLTSNRGSKLIFPDTVKLWSADEIKKRREGLTASKLKEYFTQQITADDQFKLPPEVVGRIDDFIVANPVSRATAIQVGEIEARKFVKNAADKHDIKLIVDPSVIESLALTGFSITDGARPVARQIQGFLQAAVLEARSKWDLKSGTEITLTLDKSTDAANPQIKISANGKKDLFVNAPYIKPDNPLLEKETLNRLSNLETNVKKRIIGQDAFVRSASQAIISQFGDAARKNPISLFAVGSTGTGKTEMSKALAESLYGSAERVSNIFLGKIGAGDTEMYEVFGYVGSRQESLFEKALMGSPNGGVIIFDEASNMGGHNKSAKEALFKKFYSILDEGEWASPNTGKVYKLRDYIFMFSGNDGEKLTQGISSDDIVLATWKENNARGKVRALLTEAGVPPAFLGRMSDVILMKPIVHAEKTVIAEKLLKNQIERFEAQHKGAKISYDAQFLDALASSFFTQDQGARSLRNIIENRLGGVLITALIENGYSEENLKDLSLKLSLKDNKSMKAFAVDGQPSRKIDLNIDLVKDSKVIKTSSIDLVEFASKQVLMNKNEARATAFHESGHALLNEPSLTGQRLAHVTIVGGSTGALNYLGYARYEPIEHPNSFTMESAIMRIAQLYAGSLAQQMAGHKEDAGWSQDLKVIRAVADQAIIKFGFEKELLNVQLDANGEPRLSAAQQVIFDKKKQDLISKGEQLARMVLNEQWQVVLVAQNELMQKGFMTGERFAALKEKALKSKYGTRTNEEFMKIVTARNEKKAPSISKNNCENMLKRIAGLK